MLNDLLNVAAVYENAQGSAPLGRVEKVLFELGLASTAAGIEIVDPRRAETCYIHHTCRPAAVAGYAQVSVSFARGRFPNFAFVDLIAARPAMDDGEVCALAVLCGADVTEDCLRSPAAAFGRHLWAVIDRYELGAFFERLAPTRAYGTGGEHFLTVPRGADGLATNEQNEAVRAKWRADYRKLPEYRQLLVASIIRLYNSNEKLWLVRVPKAWHAADGLKALRDAGVLADWGRLVALYPGW